MTREATFWSGQRAMGGVRCSIRAYEVSAATDVLFQEPFSTEDFEGSAYGKKDYERRAILWANESETNIEVWSSQDSRTLWSTGASRLPVRAARSVKVCFAMSAGFHSAVSLGIAGLGLQWLPDASTNFSVEAASPALLAGGPSSEVWESIESSLRWLETHPLLTSLGGGCLRVAWLRHWDVSGLQDVPPDVGVEHFFEEGVKRQRCIANLAVHRLFSGLVFLCLRALYLDLEASLTVFDDLCEAPVVVPWALVHRGLTASSETRRHLSLSAMTPLFEEHPGRILWPIPQALVCFDDTSDEMVGSDGCLGLESRLERPAPRFVFTLSDDWDDWDDWSDVDAQLLNGSAARSLGDYSLIVAGKAQVAGDSTVSLVLEEFLETCLHRRSSTFEWERAYWMLGLLGSANVGSIWLRSIEAFGEKIQRRCLRAFGAWVVRASAEDLGLWLSRESKGPVPPEGWAAFGTRMRSPTPAQALCSAGALLASLRRTSLLAMLFSLGSQTLEEADDQELQRQLMQGIGHFVEHTSCVVPGCCLSKHQSAMPRKRRSRSKYIKRMFETLLASDACDSRRACAMGVVLNVLEGRGDIEDEQLQELAQDLEAMLFL